MTLFFYLQQCLVLPILIPRAVLSQGSLIKAIAPSSLYCYQQQIIGLLDITVQFVIFGMVNSWIGLTSQRLRQCISRHEQNDLGLNSQK